MIDQIKDNGRLGKGQIRSRREICLVYLAVGSGSLHLLFNSLLSLDRFEPNWVVCVWTDQDFIQWPSFKAITVTIRKLPSQNRETYVRFRDDYFRDIANLKWHAILAMISEGYRGVVYADVDIVFLSNPTTFVERIFKFEKFAIQSEARSTFPPKFCTGFMAVRKDAKRFVRRLRRLATYRGHLANDQELFNRYFRVWRRYRLLWPLPERAFPVGHMAPLVSRESMSNTPPGSEPILFHANWTMGLDNKVAMLKSVGQWFLPDAEQ